MPLRAAISNLSSGSSTPSMCMCSSALGICSMNEAMSRTAILPPAVVGRRSYCSEPLTYDRGGVQWRIQACMAIPAATPALMERVEPNWEMDST